ncbi:MAG: hypothetical protein ABIJ41_04080 [Candidatus Omnitrophota bacterium]
MSVQFFKAITIPPPKDNIYCRLGHAKGLTQVSAEQKEKIETYLSEAVNLIELKGAALRLPIEIMQDPVIKLSQEINLKSHSLIEFLKESKEVLLMGATAGTRIGEAIRENSSGKDVTRAVVFDATASEMVDEALSWIMNYMDRGLRRENKHLTKKRFSAGYGDFSLENQKIMYDTLRLAQLGVQLTDKNILIPEKSVTAVAGINVVCALP